MLCTALACHTLLRDIHDVAAYALHAAAAAVYAITRPTRPRDALLHGLRRR